MNMSTPGKLFRALAVPGKATPVLGAINAYSAMLAVKAGAPAVYLSGSGVATASHGLPDLGITNLHDVVHDASAITSAVKAPLLVDIDTGFGEAFGIRRTIRELSRAGVAAVHMEDQVSAKRCGHRPGKQLVDTDEMVLRIKCAVDAREDPDFVIMARTDALAGEGLHSALKRSEKYLEAGADMLFVEAATEKEHYAAFHKQFPEVPLLANITEFGKTPYYTQKELGELGVALTLYPLSAHRAMAKAAWTVYSSILEQGHQKDVLDLMQTRNELYATIDYHKYEQVLDELVKKAQ